jgi:S-formylglutathione hydrolase
MPHRTHQERFEISYATHHQLPAIALWPATLSEPLPVCLFLYGGGGHHETLLSLEPLLAQAWSSGSLAPLVVACLGVPPFCFYLDDPDHDEYWQSAVAQGLLDGVRARFPERASPTPAGLVGISMGGYGALKMAFDEPARFAAVAASAPMIEPGTSAAHVPLRNRFHYPELVPPRLLGPERDPALFAADHPVTRARRNAHAIRAAGLAIYLDAGSSDALHAHDGAEYLHRVLWDLDLAHDYHLLRQANHVGPSLPPRLLRGFAWVAEHARAAQRLAEARRALRAGDVTPPSEEERALDAYLEPRRLVARQLDPSFARTHGLLPASGAGG